MLKINKILSKKIIFPLSLRGAKRRSNIKGFSLIELMVAVGILAIAIFGIFHAYSAGFMGMADARDRTVATNFAREAMEDIKNMDFELVTNENLGTAESVGEKFTRVISVNTESDNLKKITTLVYWNNRNGKTINIETSMYINRTLFNPGEAVKIVLYANPYYAVLPSGGLVSIIAVIKDKNGNTKIDWTGGNIRFSITDGSEFGFLPDGAYTPGVEPTEGKAETIFTGSAEGDVVIEASVTLPDGSTVTDTITIVVTLDAVRIELSADPYRVDADGTSTSTITAALKNSGDTTVTAATNNITFNISGEGIFVDEGGSPLPDTIIMAPSEGTATIKVKSIINTPGVVTVTASSEGLLSGTVNIITTGLPENISVSINPDLIYMDGTAEVIVVIRDINGVAVDFTGTINLNIVTGTPPGYGDFDPNSITFDGTTSTGESSFIPIATGNATIIASDAYEILNEGTADMTISEVLVASKITVSAIPYNIEAGGTKTSTITAKVKTEDNIIVSTYVEPIFFETTLGNFSNGTDNITLLIDNQDYENGIANVELFPSDTVGNATIAVSSIGLTSGSVEVGFYSSEDHIELSAVPPKMLVDGNTCTVTATVVDEIGTPINTYNEDITFTILVGWPKIAKFAFTGTSSLTKTLISGSISIYLIPQKEAGTVTLKATSFTGSTDITGYLNIPVDISLTLEGDPIYNLEENTISFSINIEGVALLLEEMQVSWSPEDSETLNKIEIDPNSTGNPVIYPDTSTPISNGEPIDVINSTLSTGVSNVKLYFNEGMSGKTLEVIFNPDSGNYHVEINEP